MSTANGVNGTTLYRIKNVIGRRGASLLALGIVNLTIGWSVWVIPPSVLAQFSLFSHTPRVILSLSWVLAGVLAIANVPRSRNDKWGFVGAYQVPFIWGCLYLAEALPPLHQFDPWLALRTVITYWGYSALVLVISGWPEAKSIETRMVAPDDDSLGHDTE
jgi:phosphatidylserine synthase